VYPDLRVPERLAQLGGAGGQQGDGLADVSPGCRGAHAEPGCQLGKCLALAQVGQDQEGLLARIQLPPQRADPDPVPADKPGHEGGGLAGQRQRSTVKQHGSPWW
jgi:hypothetical protein